MAERREDPPGEKHPGQGSAENLSAELTAAPSPGALPASPGPSSSISGTTVGHFDVIDLLGAGGFGEVYRARDTRLGRMVALKVLPLAFARDAERRERFRREAMAASALNHPNICTVHDLFESGEKTFIVMELVEGKTLHAALANGPLPVAEVLPIALQIANALAEAHRAGILHRDVKSGNILLTPRGQVKVLDFGLAKRLGTETVLAESAPEVLTREGTTLGTLSYMSPEQLLGKVVDRRSDLFSFGVVLFEMVTGQLPFEGSTPIAVSDAILHAAPRDFGKAPVPEKLKAIIRKLLEKEPGRRYASAEEVHVELKALAQSVAPGQKAGLSRNTGIALVAVGLVASASAGWLWHRASRTRWALENATPEITRLVAAGEFSKAAALIQEARAVLPKDPTLEKLWINATDEATVDSVPPGADVSIRPYSADANAWKSLGKTPLKKIRLPRNEYVWRIAKTGFAETYVIFWALLEKTFQLHPEGSVPSGMVPVPSAETPLGYPLNDAPRIKLDDYLIDKHEVTNEEYKKFVDGGGYQRRAFWKQPFVKDGRRLSWEEAEALLRDSTGRPGPATWEVGSYRKGLESHPVAGVSWYEAAAYAEFANKNLPTVYHWTRASQAVFAGLVIPGSNFRGVGTQPVGGPGTLSGFGTTDMAGNVKEWCWNESWAGKRFILGGGFGEPAYMFYQADAQSPWDRRPNYGFRCVKLLSPPPPSASARLEPVLRDFRTEKPVSDEVFNAFRGLYAYDKGELNAQVEETVTTEDWTREKVSFNAAYGGERVIAHLYLPKNSMPPYQTVVYFPGAGALLEERFDPSYVLEREEVDFLPKSGRALVFPIYKSTFERRDGLKPGGTGANAPALWRDHMIMWSKDLGRSVDYLQTRKDIDSTNMAYLGFSWGAALAPVLLAVDERFKAAILVSGGFYFRHSFPEADAINFAARVKIPVLMLNDRYDNLFTLEESQLPLFRILTTPDKDKRRVLYDSGHGGLPTREMIRETLDWLDKYLGPVRR